MRVRCCWGLLTVDEHDTVVLFLASACCCVGLECLRLPLSFLFSFAYALVSTLFSFFHFLSVFMDLVFWSGLLSSSIIFVCPTLTPVHTHWALAVWVHGSAHRLRPLSPRLPHPPRPASVCRPQRESALLELSKKREASADLAPMLWTSFGTVAALMQEIISIYPLLLPPALTAHASNRVCNSLALLQCVASHPETRSLFLAAHIPLFLYPFLSTLSKTRPFEYLRLTSLGVIGALVKMDDPDVVNFLLQTEVIPLCLHIMETGSELSKTVATFVVQKILLDANGLAYTCAAAERFFAVANVLANMVSALVEAPSPRLLKHVIRCYLRLSDNQRAREALRGCLPDALQNGTFAKILDEDATTKRWLVTLLYALNVDNSPMGSLPAPGL